MKNFDPPPPPKMTNVILFFFFFNEGFPKSNLHLYLIPPGNFFTVARKANEMEIEKESSYGYSLTYGIIKKFNKTNVTCKESLSFQEDKCKLNQVIKNSKLALVIHIIFRSLKGF